MISNHGASETKWTVRGRWDIKLRHEYGRVAAETARLMKFMDPEVETVACGSSNLDNAYIWSSWEYTVLDECLRSGGLSFPASVLWQCMLMTPPIFLQAPKGMDDFISGVVIICDAVKAKKHGKKQINLSFDEWNVWYHSNERPTKSWKNGYRRHISLRIFIISKMPFWLEAC
ncbi:MAG: hypothetical protein ACLUVM_13555 [Blautia faecis]